AFLVKAMGLPMVIQTTFSSVSSLRFVAHVPFHLLDMTEVISLDKYLSNGCPESLHNHALK
ncbi:MAG: hypothetical protein ACE5JP_14885, partial [Candidatus Bipolaricaulia bacterium]